MSASDQLAADTVHVPCPLDTCPAGVDEPCVNPITGETAHVPHIDRIKAAGESGPVGHRPTETPSGNDTEATER